MLHILILNESYEEFEMPTLLALTISHYLNAFISSKLLLAAAVSFIILFLPFSRSSFTTRKRGVRVRVLKLCNGERDPGKLVEEINQYRGR